MLSAIKSIYWQGFEAATYRRRERRFLELQKRFEPFTMMGRNRFLNNLRLCHRFRGVPGAVVECGTWKGGMIAAIASTLGNSRPYYLFDSYEGLPAPTANDGADADEWSRNTTSRPGYFNNCTAAEADAHAAMRLSGAADYTITKGWFKDTLPQFNTRIAILRIDGDWYESTMTCLTNMLPNVVSGGLVIIDDYYDWDGCAKAVHDFLSKTSSVIRLRQYADGIVCYFVVP